MSNQHKNSETKKISVDIPETMKAMVAERYGQPEILEMKEIDVPTIEDHGVLVKFMPPQ